MTFLVCPNLYGVGCGPGGCLIALNISGDVCTSFLAVVPARREYMGVALATDWHFVLFQISPV